MTSEPWYHAAGVAGIFLLSLLSEDSATLTGAFLAALGNLPWSLAFAACFLGIWAGDLVLYGLARFCGRPMLSALLLRGETKSLQKGEEWFVRHGIWALVVCRFVPGTRLPTFLAAGFLGMPIARFALSTGLLAAGWVGLAFVLFRWFEMRTDLASDLHGVLQLMMFSLLALVLFLTRGRWLLAIRRLRASAAIQRWLK
ncbi:MAG TPA: DedA family protein, partial [Terrimicrobiaceae bacterium]|nr:DedA family protein [Terrimicrobiaceae bacterium]